MGRHLVSDVSVLQRLIPNWLHREFAFDIESEGLDERQHRMLGLALTFPSTNGDDEEESVYIVLGHTEVQGAIVTKTRTVEKIVGYEDIPDLTPKGKHRVNKQGNPKFKTVPIYRAVEETYEEDQRSFPYKQFIEPQTFADIVQPLFGQHDVVMVAHHSKFDLKFLDRVGIAVRGKLFDTMNAAQHVNENRGVGLKNLASEMLGMPMVEFTGLERYPGFKSEEFLGVPLEIGSDYAMRDTEATWRLFQILREQLVEEGVETAFYDICMPLTITLFEMERTGIALDLDKVREVREEYAAKSRTAEREVWSKGIDMVLDLYLGDDEALVESPFAKPITQVLPDYDGVSDVIEIHGVELPVIRVGRKAPRIPWFNVGSNPQLGVLLYEHMEIKVPKDVKLRKTASGEDAVNSDTLKTIRLGLGDDAPPILSHILDYRKATKFIGTYLDRFLEEAGSDPEHAIRTQFNQHIAVTGRLTSSDPNLQNIPSRGEEGKKARLMFVARPGKKLLVADYSQMELRMIAHYSGDEKLLAAFEQGLDLHVVTGSGQASLSYEDLLERCKDDDDINAKKLRMIGKTSNFALSYGMHAKTFQLRLLVDNGMRVTVREAKRLIDEYDATYEGATAFKQKVRDVVAARGFVRTMHGRKRRLPEVWSDDQFQRFEAERQAINYIIQGTCAEVMAMAIPKVQAALAPFGGEVLLQIHDECVSEIDEENVEVGAKIVSEIMEGVINHKLRCPMIAEAHWADSWGAAKG